MATHDLTNFAAFLKQKYLPAIANGINTKTVLMNRLKRMSWAGGGRSQVMPIIGAYNTAIGARAESATLPTPSRGTYAAAEFYRTSTYGAFKISGWVMDADRSDAAANALDVEMKGLMRAMLSDCNRQLNGDGSGLLSTVAATGSSGTTVAINTTGSGSAGNYGFKYLRQGMPVDVLLKSSGATTNGVLATTISAINRSAGTITLADATAGAVDQTYGIYHAGCWTSNAGSGTTNEAYGITAAICDDANPGVDTGHTSGDIGNGTSGRYGDINRASSPPAYYQGNILENGGVLRNITWDMIAEAIDLCEINGDGTPTLGLLDHEMFRTLGELIRPQQRWNDMVKRIDGGFEAIEYNGLTFVKDKDCIPNTIHLIDESTFRIISEKELGIMSADGLTMLRTGTTDEYVGQVYMRFQLGCNNPPANCTIRDIAPVNT